MRIRQRGSALGALPISPLLVARIALGAFGVWVASIGLRALLRGHPFAANAPVGRWLVSGVLAHDAVIAPTVFLLGAVTVRLVGPRTRQALAAILLIGGSVLIVGLPDVLRKGRNANPTVTPLDYTRNLLIVLLAVVGGVVLATAASALRQRRRDRGAPMPLVPSEPGPEMYEAEPEPEPEPEADGVAEADTDAGDDDVSAADDAADIPDAEDKGHVLDTEAAVPDAEAEASTNPREPA
jgi:hypothetical protein